MTLGHVLMLAALAVCAVWFVALWALMRLAHREERDRIIARERVLAQRKAAPWQ